MKRFPILFLILALTCLNLGQAYGQKAKYKNGILTGPNNEYQVKLSYILGKPKVNQTTFEDKSTLVTVIDDQCRDIGIQNYGATTLQAEDWTAEPGYSDLLKETFKGDTLVRSILDTQYGKAVLFTFTAKNASPCMSMTFPGDGTRKVTHPDAKAGIAYQNINGVMYAFYYFLDNEIPIFFREDEISDVTGTITGLINSFKPKAKVSASTK